MANANECISPSFRLHGMRSLIERHVSHRIVLAIPRPQLGIVQYGRRHDERISQFDTVSLAIIPEVVAGRRPVSPSMGTQSKARNRLVSGLCSRGRAPAQSSAAVTVEYRTRCSDPANSSHFARMSWSLSRETSMRRSESTSTHVTLHPPPRTWRMNGSASACLLANLAALPP